MPADARIRKARPEDAGTIGRLLSDFNAEFDSPSPEAGTFARRLTVLLGRDDVLVLLAEVDERDVGVAFLTLRPTPYADGPLAQLEELYVRPDQRSRGVGTLLVEELLARLRGLQVAEVHVGVDEPDTDARRFYERHGFSNVQPGTEERMLLYLRET